jgi:MYXO-CTERM domain-containing protein
MRNSSTLISGAVAAVAVAGSATAAVVTAFTPTGGSILNDTGNGNDLLVFTVGASDIVVTSLGAFNGYVGSRAVGIFAWNGSNAGTGPVLVSGNVTTVNTQVGFSYAAVTSTTLTAGQQYVLVGQSFSGMNSYTTVYANAGAGSGISFNSYGYNGGAPLDPSTVAISYSPAYFGPNFQFSVVPAPGAVALLGAAGLVGTRRRRS